jgi:superfamily II DNA/RNA helicase
VRAGALHGGKAQNARTRVLGEFREGTTPVLVATDVAARGIHVDDVSLVVHVDPPADPKDYLHRAGRTARAGQSGTVVTLVTHDQRRAVQGMTARAGVRPNSTKVRPGDEELIRITGARLPSGEPVVDAPPPARPARRGGPRGRFASGRGEFRGESRGGREFRGGPGGERGDRSRGERADRPWGERGERTSWGDRGQSGRGERSWSDRGQSGRGQSGRGGQGFRTERRAPQH